MDVDRTHSRAIAAAAAANTEADSISEDVHARKWPGVVGNRGEMSFMQSIHVYCTRISGNHRASSMGAWNFETRIVRSHSQSFPIWTRFHLIADKSTSFVVSVFSYRLKMAVGYDEGQPCTDNFLCLHQSIGFTRRQDSGVWQILYDPSYTSARL